MLKTVIPKIKLEVQLHLCGVFSVVLCIHTCLQFSAGTFGCTVLH